MASLLTVRHGSAIVLVVLLPVLVSSSCPSLSNPFITIGTGTPHTYKAISFQIGGVYVRADNYAQTQDTIRLLGTTANRIHIIATSGYAANVPNGVVAGHIVVRYEDGTSEKLDLIVGENTAEWAYDRKELQCCIRHARVSPAYSWRTDMDSASKYWGHSYYSSIDLEPKRLDSLHLILDADAYSAQPSCPPPPCPQTDPERYSILISAITLETGD
jgi:hypothetical protein